MTTKFCLTCQHTGKPKSHTRGSIWIEIVLWIFFIVPGVIYSLWRLTTRQQVCVECGSPTLVPVNSIAAQRLAGAK